MENKKYWTIGGVALILIGGYIVYKKLFGKPVPPAGLQAGGQVSDASNTSTPSGGTSGGNVVNDPFGIVQFLSNYNDYEVITKNVGLNVRQKPNANSKPILSLPSGSTIKAKASGTKGWMAVSKDGEKLLGYVSVQYLKAKQKQK